MRKSDSKQAFTLIELLVAMGIASILILTCGMLMRIGAKDHEAVTRQLAWEREINVLVEFLTADLAAAHGSDWYHWHHVHQGATQGALDACQVGWLSLKPISLQDPDAAIGDLCAVGYKLADHSLGADQVQRCLLRQQLDSNMVFEAAASDDEQELWKLHPTAEPLVDGVLLFELWPMLRKGPESWQPWHPELCEMPDAVELHMVLAAPALQRRLKTSEDWRRAASDLKQWGAEEVWEVRNLIHLGGDARY